MEDIYGLLRGIVADHMLEDGPIGRALVGIAQECVELRTGIAALTERVGELENVEPQGVVAVRSLVK